MWTQLLSREGCGPGKGSGRRRRPRKLTPLVFKQHVPNVSENTLGASGLSEGPIKRRDAKFKDLVRNNNPDIIFKDEEGTGADRIMTQRCKDKLNALSISVLNLWPGVKLRVTEAWDENEMHAENSLHYEGRAVDITTSDRDRSKYGMLARLAVEAGFDWVYYETRGQIHCSVKSDSSIAIGFGGCFPPTSSVITDSGQTKFMSRLQVGDRILTINQNGGLEFSDVISFLDISQEKVAHYYTLTTQSGHSITLTGKHLIHTTKLSNYTSNLTSTHVLFSSDLTHLTFAEEITTGQSIFVVKDKTAPSTENIQGLISPSLTDSHSSLTNNAGRREEDSAITNLVPEKVVSIKLRPIRGVYAPLTLQGTVIVDNIAASCYAFVKDEQLAHSVFTPMRRYYVITRLLGDWLGSFCGYFDWMNTFFCFSETKRNETILQKPKDGTHWYAKLLYMMAVHIFGIKIDISV